MPSVEDIEAYLRQNAGQPVQQGANKLGQAVEDKYNDAADATSQAALSAKQAILQRLAGQPQAVTPPTPPVPDVLPNSPTMSPQDAQSRMGAMIQAPLRGGTPMTFDAMQQQNAANMAASGSPEQSQEDMSGYKDFSQHPVLRQFPKIQAKVQAQKPITKDDIRSMTSPNEALSEDQESAINKQLNPDEDEEK